MSVENEGAVGVATYDDLKANILKHVAEWLDDPGNAQRLILEVHEGIRRDTPQRVRAFDVKTELHIVHAEAGLDAPAIIPIAGMPVGFPPIPGNGRR